MPETPNYFRHQDYDVAIATEPENEGLCPCGNPVHGRHDRCRECLAEIRAEERGERI